MEQAVQNRQAIADIKFRYDNGVITREQAKKEALPVLTKINEDIKVATDKLNKKYNMNRRPAYLDFINAMRNSY